MATKKTEKKPKKEKAAKKPRGSAAATSANEAKAPAGDQPNLRIETFMAEQPCKLSDEDVKQRSKLAAKLVAKRDKVRETAKSESKARRLEIQGIEEQIRTTSQEVREEVTHRMVKCERHFNYDTKRVTDIRLDTGEITGTPRDMTDAELQTFFNFDEPLPPPAGGSAEDDLDNEFGGGDAEDEDEADPR
jgi:chemotaxis protein histidine kinase CheA